MSRFVICRVNDLVAEMPDPGEDHRHPEPIRGFDHFLITHRPSRLDNCSGAGLGDLFDAVWEREESVGRSDRPLERQLRFHRSQLAGVDSAHLSSADADGLTVTGVEDCIRLQVLANLPGKKQRASFFRRWRALGDHLEISFSQLMQVRISWLKLISRWRSEEHTSEL